MHKVSKALLEFFNNNPKKWTHIYYARDKLGFPVSPIDPAACSWCLLGAIKVLEHNIKITNNDYWNWRDKIKKQYDRSTGRINDEAENI